jgi:hypothetical protein
MDRPTKEAKLKAVTDIVASYVKSGGDSAQAANLSPDQVCQLVKQLSQTIEDCYPEDNNRRVGLV